jgi:vacuolar-type H+-ATPase subunit C/Vma6
VRDLLARPDLAGQLEVLRASVWAKGVAEGRGAALEAVEEALEEEERRWAARLLEEMEGGPRRLLAAFLLLRDAEALKAPLRALARSLSAERAAALLEPSPGLDRRALLELTSCTDAAAAAARLAERGSPFAGAVAAHAGGLDRPGALLRLEVALDGVAFQAALRASRGPGEDRRVLRRIVAARADLACAGTLLALAGEPDVEGLRAPGAERIGEEDFRRLAALPSPRLPEALARALEDLLGPAAATAVQLASPLAADHLLGRALARAVRREARASPLSLAVPCAWVLDLAEELRRVRLALRGAAVGYPPAALLDLLEA